MKYVQSNLDIQNIIRIKIKYKYMHLGVLHHWH